MRRDGVVRRELVVVDDGMFAGMFAMTVAMTVSGDTPSVPGAQPVTSRKDAAAIAPTRAGVGVIMLPAKAGSTPRGRGIRTGCQAMR
jgi:hypothetical protein